MLNFFQNFGAISMADIPVTFKTCEGSPRIGMISCPVPYIRKRILDCLRKCTEVERCWPPSRFGAEIYFYVSEGHTSTETLDKICIICPMFIAEGVVCRSWIRRNFWLLWGAVFGLLYLLNTVGHIIEGSISDSAVSWGIGMIIVVTSLTNYARGMKHENALLSCVRETFIEEIKKIGGIK